jgi:hypothetical protein
MSIRRACGPPHIRPCRNYRSIGLGIMRNLQFLSEYGRVVNEVKFGYMKLIRVLRAKDDKSDNPLLVVEEYVLKGFGRV